jgi:ParB family chromosome partitioning protein
MSASLTTPELMRVAIDLVDEPDITMRQSFDPGALDELVDSIRAVGIIQPLALVRTGERFRVAAGHRRAIAAVLAGCAEVPANVYPEGTPIEEVLKNHENTRREKVNPGDEALYFKRLLDERCAGDTQRLAGLVGEKQGYVEGRLDLLRGWPEVLDALRARTISVTAALEFNRYKDHGFMLSHLKAAIQSGAKASQIARWRSDLERMLDENPNVPTDLPPLPAGQAPAPRVIACCVCGESHDPYNLEFMYIHRGGPCAKILERALGAMGK